MNKTLVFATLCAAAAPLFAQTPEAAHGLWLSAQKDGVIEIKPCADEAGALCGAVVWDKDASVDPPRPGDCGVRIFKLKRFDDGAWREGWIHDPRDKKNYKGLLRTEGNTLTMRAFIGVQILGKSETFTRVDRVPPGCPAVR